MTTPSWTAAAAKTGFITLPGSKGMVIARLIRMFAETVLNSPGANVGHDVIASTSPVKGSMTTPVPHLAPNSLTERVTASCR